MGRGHTRDTSSTIRTSAALSCQIVSSGGSPFCTPLHTPYSVYLPLSGALAGKGEHERALALFREGLTFAESVGDEAIHHRLLNCLGWVHADLGDLDGDGADELVLRATHGSRVEELTRRPRMRPGEGITGCSSG